MNSTQKNESKEKTVKHISTNAHPKIKIYQGVNGRGSKLLKLALKSVSNNKSEQSGSVRAEGSTIVTSSSSQSLICEPTSQSNTKNCIILLWIEGTLCLLFSEDELVTETKMDEFEFKRLYLWR